MQADIHLLFKSPLFSVIDFRCKERPGARSAAEYCVAHEITFTRTGYFDMRMPDHNYTVDTRGILLHNPNAEYFITHGEQVRDTCTIVQIEESVLQDARDIFWKRNGGSSADDSFTFRRNWIASNPRLDYLHHSFFVIRGGILRKEILLMDMIRELFAELYGPENQDIFTDTTHIDIIERAKLFLNENFDQDVSLAAIARAAHASAFHFSRIFKRNTSYSPYRYLQEIRLKHAALLLRNTSNSVTEICFDSGFRSFSHFIASFTGRFAISPSRFRRTATHN